MKKIGILFQIANFSVWEKMKNIIDNFDFKVILLIHFNTDLISKDYQNKIISFYQNKDINPIITTYVNKGMDICGFFNQIEYIINNNIDLDYILKIHTKSNDTWRDHLIDPICGTKENVKKCLDILDNDEDIGYICCKRWYRLMDHFNTPIILEELKKFNIENTFIDEINWHQKYENLYDLDYFDPNFYLEYPYNSIYRDPNIEKDKEKLKSYALFHWLQIGYKEFRLVHNKNLISKKNKHIKFCAGSIFWIKADIIVSFFKNNINFNYYYDKFEKGYFKNDKPTLTHTWERFFSIIIENLRKKTIVL
tara:strand:+ start:32 stop:955 length:924 start_codon:yes stop_codon:yes gene_type:complete